MKRALCHEQENWDICITSIKKIKLVTTIKDDQEKLQQIHQNLNLDNFNLNARPFLTKSELLLYELLYNVT